MATALQHEAPTLSPRIQATSTGKHHPYGGQKNDALTFETDQSVGAGHDPRLRRRRTRSGMKKGDLRLPGPPDDLQRHLGQQPVGPLYWYHDVKARRALEAAGRSGREVRLQERRKAVRTRSFDELDRNNIGPVKTRSARWRRRTGNAASCRSPPAAEITRGFAQDTSRQYERVANNRRSAQK